MKSNDEILNELFFKKKSYSEKLKDSQAQYTPVKDTKGINSLFGGAKNGAPVFSDVKEINKRLVGALSMTLGNNTVKNIAGKAIKSFPIIVSDDVAPETLVMIKTMMEEQYASYLDLLISNQIINISDYEPASQDKGNIAIQALNRIDGTDFSTSRIANKMQTGNISADDLLQNVAGWQVLKTNEGMNFASGNPITDLFLEDALIVDSSHKEEAIRVLQETMLDEAYYEGDKNPVDADIIADNPGATIAEKDVYFNKKDNAFWIYTNGKWVKKNQGDNNSNDKKDKDIDVRIDSALSDMRVGLAKSDFSNYGKYSTIVKNANGNNEVKYGFSKLLSPSALVNGRDLEDNMDRSIAQILTGEGLDKSSKEFKVSLVLRDKFEKASYLLASNRISGFEFCSYLTDRLGIPVATSVRQEICYKFKTKDVIFKGSSMVDPNDEKNTITDKLGDAYRDAIYKNKKFVIFHVVPNVVSITAKQATMAILVGAGAGVAGVSAGAITATAIGATLSAPILWPVFLGAAGVGAIGGFITKMILVHNKKENKDSASTAIEGWERVEQLINEMEYQRSQAVKPSLEKQEAPLEVKEYDLKSFKNDMAAELKKISEVRQHMNFKTESFTFDPRPFAKQINESYIQKLQQFYDEVDKEVESDTELFEQITRENLEESNKFGGLTISTKTPITIKQKKFNPKDISTVVPNFGTRDVLAYGSVEYDKRDLKDRKFNEPLLMTITFKERYSDGKYSDNELTAVIGILGVITRVPSEEMTTILKTNAEGKTLSNFFKGDEANSSKDLVANVISGFMGTKYAEKLPTSGKIWANLEKVSSLAIANKLAGNNNGNISNAHIVFSQKEMDQVKNETGIDYLKNAKLTAKLMKRYAAFMVMSCNDAMQIVHSYNDPDAISWDDAPYSAYMGKSNSDQLLSAFTQYNRMKL